MSEVVPQAPPRLRRSRPTDATGLFWCLVFLLISGLTSLADATLFSACCVLACPVCLVWQVVNWCADVQTVREATAWSGRYYGDAGEVPVVDVVVALMRCYRGRLQNVTPQTPLNHLNWMVGDVIPVPATSVAELHRVWLDDLLVDAGVRDLDTELFTGETLDDAIQLVIRGESQRLPVP